MTSLLPLRGLTLNTQRDYPLKTKRLLRVAGLLRRYDRGLPEFRLNGCGMQGLLKRASCSGCGPGDCTWIAAEVGLIRAHIWPEWPVLRIGDQYRACME